jgi:hypothetical protein
MSRNDGRRTASAGDLTGKRLADDRAARDRRAELKRRVEAKAEAELAAEEDLLLNDPDTVEDLTGGPDGMGVGNARLGADNQVGAGR